MSKNNLGILKRDNSILLVIDVQEKFKPVIYKWNSLVDNIIKLVKSFQILKVPIIVTEQYTKGLGKTTNKIRNTLSEYKPIEKREFSCLKNKAFFKKLKNSKKKNLIICGIESHVCIINTLLGAISNNFKVHLVVDAISSRKKSDVKIAIERAKQAEAFLTTTEMVIFQLTGTSKFKNFKEIIKIVK